MITINIDDYIGFSGANHYHGGKINATVYVADSIYYIKSSGRIELYSPENYNIVSYDELLEDVKNTGSVTIASDHGGDYVSHMSACAVMADALAL